VKDFFGGMIFMFRGFVGVIILLMVGVILLVVVIGVLVYVWY